MSTLTLSIRSPEKKYQRATRPATCVSIHKRAPTAERSAAVRRRSLSPLPDPLAMSRSAPWYFPLRAPARWLTANWRAKGHRDHGPGAGSTVPLRFHPSGTHNLLKLQDNFAGSTGSTKSSRVTRMRLCVCTRAYGDHRFYWNHWNPSEYAIKTTAYGFQNRFQLRSKTGTVEPVSHWNCSICTKIRGENASFAWQFVPTCSPAVFCWGCAAKVLGLGTVAGGDRAGHDLVEQLEVGGSGPSTRHSRTDAFLRVCGVRSGVVGMVALERSAERRRDASVAGGRRELVRLREGSPWARSARGTPRPPGASARIFQLPGTGDFLDFRSTSIAQINHRAIGSRVRGNERPIPTGQMGSGVVSLSLAGGVDRLGSGAGGARNGAAKIGHWHRGIGGPCGSPGVAKPRNVAKGAARVN